MNPIPQAKPLDTRRMLDNIVENQPASPLSIRENLDINVAVASLSLSFAIALALALASVELVL